MITRVVGGQQLLRVVRIAGGFVEVDDAVVSVTGADPLVQGLSLGFAASV